MSYDDNDQSDHNISPGPNHAPGGIGWIVKEINQLLLKEHMAGDLYDIGHCIIVVAVLPLNVEV